MQQQKKEVIEAKEVNVVSVAKEVAEMLAKDLHVCLSI